MASNINPSLEPTKSLVNFRFWCQKVLPLVYDDSLSYYEILGKMVVQLNDVIDNVNADTENVLTLKDAFLELQTYVNNFFDDIDQLASYAERAEAAQTAANASAINASESASNASTSSLAAMDARDAAVTAKQVAETSANTASTAADNANTKASEAAQSAITAQTAQASASQSATLAATDRSTAQAAANTATSKASEANASAENAAQSEANAEELVNNIQENLENIQQNTQDIDDLKNSISPIQEPLFTPFLTKQYTSASYNGRNITVNNNIIKSAGGGSGSSYLGVLLGNSSLTIPNANSANIKAFVESHADQLINLIPNSTILLSIYSKTGAVSGKVIGIYTMTNDDTYIGGQIINITAANYNHLLFNVPANAAKGCVIYIDQTPELSSEIVFDMLPFPNINAMMATMLENI